MGEAAAEPYGSTAARALLLFALQVALAAIARSIRTTLAESNNNSLGYAAQQPTYENAPPTMSLHSLGEWSDEVKAEDIQLI